MPRVGTARRRQRGRLPFVEGRIVLRLATWAQPTPMASLPGHNNTAMIDRANRRLSVANFSAEVAKASLRQLAPDAANLADDLEINDNPSQLWGGCMQHGRYGWMSFGKIGIRSGGTHITDQTRAYAALAGPSNDGPEGERSAGVLEKPVAESLAATRGDTTSASVGHTRQIGGHFALEGPTNRIRSERDGPVLYAPGLGHLRPRNNRLSTPSRGFVS